MGVFGEGAPTPLLVSDPPPPVLPSQTPLIMRTFLTEGTPRPHILTTVFRTGWASPAKQTEAAVGRKVCDTIVDIAVVVFQDARPAPSRIRVPSAKLFSPHGKVPSENSLAPKEGRRRLRIHAEQGCVV